jgi:hypothetical protein
MRVHIANLAAGMRGWPARRWLVAEAAAVAFALVVGMPTDVIPNPLANRVEPVTWWSYPTLAVTAVLGGLVFATYVRSAAQPVATGKTTGGGLLSALAIGCPVCTKLVVLALGTTGAMSLWAPLQPVLAVASLILLGWALRIRLAAERACPMPSAGSPSPRSGPAPT